MNADKKVTALFEFKPVGFGPDLTGEWSSLIDLKCKDTKKGMKCSIKGKLAIKNIGHVDTKKSTSVRFYLSEDDILDSGDFFLKSVATGKIKKGKHKTKTFSYRFALDEDVSGKYIIAFIDEFNNIDEIDESNNIIVFGPLP
jgi:hypothetical protein